MTREEAIVLFEKQLTAAQVVLDSGFGSNPGENDSLYRRRKEMAEIALTALRPVSREQVEKVWPGCEKCRNQANWPSWIEKGFVYCPKCGTPLTSWAWEKQMKRLEGLKDGL
nr:MAG TPA: DNA-directed RNA polymerase [Caudoviricetes sp.]